jgi:multicomponent Na+:H+ antiporter subunit G
MWGMILDWIGAALLAIGVLFMVLGAVGIVRMPDVFMRLQASSKAATLGIGSILLAVALEFGDLTAVVRSLAFILFTWLTVPVAAHALGLAAHQTGAPMWPHTHRDELKEHQAHPPPPAPRNRPDGPARAG